MREEGIQGERNDRERVREGKYKRKEWEGEREGREIEREGEREGKRREGKVDRIKEREREGDVEM